MNALIGKKRGMTQVWDDDGTRVSVTVLDLGPNTVTAVKTVDRDGYDAVQLGFEECRTKVKNKPELGQFKKAGIETPLRHLREVRTSDSFNVGDTVTMDGLFEAGKRVDVVGTSKGKGFAGTIKRYGFARGPSSHGSQNVRAPGSIGMCKYPGRVIKGKKMAGRMGHERVTVRGLTVVRVDADNNQLLVKGPVPGPNGSLVVVKTSLKEGGR